MPKSSILMLITNLTFGGAQRVFYDHSRLLAAEHDVTEVVFNRADGHAFESGNPILDLDVAGGGSALKKLANFARRVRRLTAVKRRLSPALTISHLEGADYINLLAGGPGSRMLVIHGSKLHDAGMSGPLGWLRRHILIPHLYNRADAIVTVSREIAIELKTLGVRTSRIHPIHNFFDPVAIRSLSLESMSSDEQALFAGPPVLVTSGRLTRQKNHSAMIAIFRRLLEQRSARLVLIGDGELRAPLIAQALALGLRVAEGAAGQADVYFLGYQDNPFRLQRHADLFLLTSGWEGFPMVLGEAMACGLPIISADCPTGPREFLAPDTVGQVVRPIRAADAGPYGMLMPIPTAGERATIDPWVDTLDAMLGNPALLQAMGAASLARAEDFTRERIGRQWLALVDELIGAAPTSA